MDLPIETSIRTSVARMMDRLCTAGLANLNYSKLEVLCASAWESQEDFPPQASFANAIKEELKALNGALITTTQLVSRLHSLRSVRAGISIPIHKRVVGNQPPALVHRIEKTPTPTSLS